MAMLEEAQWALRASSSDGSSGTKALDKALVLIEVILDRLAPGDSEDQGYGAYDFTGTERCCNKTNRSCRKVFCAVNHHGCQDCKCSKCCRKICRRCCCVGCHCSNCC